MSKPTYTDGDLLIADQDKLRDWEGGECEAIDCLRPATLDEIEAAWDKDGKKRLEFKNLQSMIINFVDAPACTNEVVDVYGQMVRYVSSIGRLTTTPEDLEER